jgi:hypothetical protein
VVSFLNIVRYWTCFVTELPLRTYDKAGALGTVPGRNLQVGLPIVGHTPALTDLAEEVMNLYVPDMEVCEYTGICCLEPPPSASSSAEGIKLTISGSGCCTDNKPFYDNGFPASRFFEACGSLDDPMYHTPEDAFPREVSILPVPARRSVLRSAAGRSHHQTSANIVHCVHNARYTQLRYTISLPRPDL